MKTKDFFPMAAHILYDKVVIMETDEFVLFTSQKTERQYLEVKSLNKFYWIRERVNKEELKFFLENTTAESFFLYLEL